jgi:hypothetical protein
MLCVALETLEERECSCKVFSLCFSVCKVLVLAGIGSAVRTYDIHLCSVHVQEV